VVLSAWATDCRTDDAREKRSQAQGQAVKFAARRAMPLDRDVDLRGRYDLSVVCLPAGWHSNDDKED